MNAAALYQPLLPEYHLDGFAQRFGTIDDDEQLALTLQAARDQVLQETFDHSRILCGTMPKTQNVLFTLQIHANGCHQAIAAKELAVDHQDQQILRNGSLHETLQFLSRRRFPMPADAGALDPITLKTAFNGPFVVPGRTLAGELALHRFLELAILLKCLVAGQGHLLILPAAQPWPLQPDFTAPVDDVTGLMSVPTSRLLAPPTNLLLDFGFQDLLDDGQPQFGREGFNILGYSGDQFAQRQLSLQTHSFFISCFFFGFFHLSLVLSHRWFSWLLVICFNRPSCLMDGRRTTSNSNYRRDISKNFHATCHAQHTHHESSTPNRTDSAFRTPQSAMRSPSISCPACPQSQASRPQRQNRPPAVPRTRHGQPHAPQQHP